MKKIYDINEISGGYGFLIYPALGCSSFMLVQRLDNSDASYKDYGKSCFRGALHGANPGLGIVGKLVTNPFGRYIGNIGYAFATQKITNGMMSPESQRDDVCPFYFDGQSGGVES